MEKSRSEEDAVTLPDISLASSYFEEGNRWLRENCPQKALSSYYSVLKINRRYVEVYFNIGVCYEKLENTEAAARSYANLLGSRMHCLSALSYIANIYIRLQQFQKAIDVYNEFRVKHRAICTAEVHQEVAYRISELYAMKKQYFKAIQYLDQITRDNPLCYRAYL